MALIKVNYIDNETVITAANMNAIQDEVIKNSEIIENGIAAPTLRATYDEETQTMKFENVPKEVEDQLYAPIGLVRHIIEDPTSDDDLDAQLKAIFDNMPVDTVSYCAMRSSSATTSFGGGRVTFTIVKQASGYGLVKAMKYWQGTQVRKQQRLVFNNVWHPWDWVNPPMDLGGEYRTTERYGSKVVYTKLVDCGAFPSMSVKTVPHGVSGANIIRFAGSSSYFGIALPYYEVDKYVAGTPSQPIAEVWAHQNNIYVACRISTWTNSNCYVQIWYTKD